MRARKQYKIDTLDLDKNKGIGISIPYNPDNIFNITYTTKDQIKTNLLNFMLTNKGERYFNPEFGANLRNTLFEQNMNTEELQASLADQISLYFPSVTVNELLFTPDYDNNALNIKLNYTVNMQTDSLSIQIV